MCNLWKPPHPYFIWWMLHIICPYSEHRDLCGYYWLLGDWVSDSWNSQWTCCRPRAQYCDSHFIHITLKTYSQLHLIRRSCLFPALLRNWFFVYASCCWQYWHRYVSGARLHRCVNFWWLGEQRGINGPDLEFFNLLWKLDYINNLYFNCYDKNTNSRSRSDLTTNARAYTKYMFRSKSNLHLVTG